VATNPDKTLSIHDGLVRACVCVEGGGDSMGRACV
jgi:hypothetical protein